MSAPENRPHGPAPTDSSAALAAARAWRGAAAATELARDLQWRDGMVLWIITIITLFVTLLFLVLFASGPVQ